MKLSSILLQGLMQAGKPTTASSALPWPKGSVLAGRLETTTTAMPTLIIANQKFQTMLPPGLLAKLPPGQLWFELLNRESPASFRILSRQQAIDIIAGRLAEMASNKQTDAPTQPQQRPTHSPWNQQEGFPFNANESANGYRIMLEDRESQQPRGMIEKEGDADSFALHGRIDMDQLGTLYFALQQQPGTPPQLKLRAAAHQSFVELRQPFHDWLSEKQQNTENTNRLLPALKADLSEGNEPVLQARISAVRQI
ncbi:MAG: hypothetical protein Q9M31_07795 [Mariprofundus sp.]|nr:hypothetical protein [Mariprofundus sp.]